MPQGVTEGIWQVRDFEQITTLSAAVGISNAEILKGQFVIITPVTQAVRYRDDGTNPTAAIGIFLQVNVPFVYAGDLSAIKFFEVAASAELNIAGYS